MSDSQNELSYRQEIVRIGAMLHQKGFVGATDGNISVRLERDQVLVTPSGVSKGFMTPAQMVLTDLDGRVLQTERLDGRTMRPSSEFPMHLQCYGQRPDVRAVVHAHPPVAIACTIAGISLSPPVLPEVVVTLGTVPTAPYATPGTPEGAAAIRELILQRDAILLDHHGVVAVGQSVMDAYLKLEKVEHAAEIILAATQLGRVTTLQLEQIETLLEIRAKYGLLREGDEVLIRDLAARGWPGDGRDCS